MGHSYINCTLLMCTFLLYFMGIFEVIHDHNYKFADGYEILDLLMLILR